MKRWPPLLRRVEVRPADIRPIALAVRLTPAAAAIVAVLATADPFGPWTVVTVLLVVGAMVTPQRSVAGFAVGATFVGWLISSGWSGHPPAARTITFAAALYVLHSALAIGAMVPITARVEPALVTRWLRRTATVALGSAALIAVQYALQSTGPSHPLEAAGLICAAGVVAAAVTLARWTTERH